MKQIAVIITLLASCVLCYKNEYPVPIPAGGRNAVHGWLILPWEQPEPKEPTTKVSAWFVHHTPEFWTDSPHNFQLILGGTLTPMSVAENITDIIPLPYPPSAELLVDEFTFTPPPPFSLNDLLSGGIKQLIGVFFNGSFDTPYERVAEAIATLDITSMPTATWLNISSAIVPYTFQRYLSYPRSATVETQGQQHYYLSHEIHAAPDFDSVIHVTIDLDTCSCSSCSATQQQEMLTQIHQAGAEWEMVDFKNTLSDRLTAENAPKPFNANLLGWEEPVTCSMSFLEEIHCVVGPGFFNKC